MPYIISDEMPPTEQVDGVHYTSKAKFRAVGPARADRGRQRKIKPKQRAASRENKVKRRRTLERGRGVSDGDAGVLTSRRRRS
jgi:hypothetical protein